MTMSVMLPPTAHPQQSHPACGRYPTVISVTRGTHSSVDRDGNNGSSLTMWGLLVASAKPLERAKVLRSLLGEVVMEITTFFEK